VSAQPSSATRRARDYYNSDDADHFYHAIWGGEDIHIGLYDFADEDIATASERTVATMAGRLRNLNPESRIVDLGAGYGGAARWLAATTGCHVSCVNLSEGQNARNRELTRAAGLEERVDVRDASFDDIPFGSALFDVAWSQDSILHADDRERVLREVDRVLVPNGEFIFTDPMQADACPPGVLAPVLERIHLDSLASVSFYRRVAQELGWQEVAVLDMTGQLIRHYSRVQQELRKGREGLVGKVSPEYIDRMVRGLSDWISAGEKGYLAWGILHFRKTS
jgi:sarcosine/dimethylglycine N-methyltransferase